MSKLPSSAALRRLGGTEIAASQHAELLRFMKPSEISADGFAPGGLRYCMSESRARKLGEPLGIC